ncbi:hypothetical protein U9M48_038058 [Paspalum notatum var. saurae]|uniref:Uncharacterized protein n=1 Tax=Paspalum notatum var. saurae TaxID=547442 RepID=A0AAQ3UHS0_PASNO
MAARIGARSGAPADLAAAPGGPRLGSRGGALAALASARGGGAPKALATAMPTVGSPALRWRAPGGKARRGPEERRRPATRETRAFEESGEELSVRCRHRVPVMVSLLLFLALSSTLSFFFLGSADSTG